MTNYHSQEAYQARIAQRRANPVPPTPFATWWHIAALHGVLWRDIVREQLADIKRAGIPADTVHACVLGTEDDARWVASLGIPVIARHDDLTQYECYTLQHVYEYAQAHPTGAVLYLHTKGASAPWDRHKTAWRRLLMETVVARWREHLDTLAVADMVSTAWIHNPRYPHYSGNIWLVRCDWLASLPPPIAYRDAGGPVINGHPWRRMAAEMWLGSRPYHKMSCVAFENWCLVGDVATYACELMHIAPACEPPTLHVVTPVSRPQNLTRIHASIHHLRRCRIRWHVIADAASSLPARPPCSCIATWQPGQHAHDTGGYRLRNTILDMITTDHPAPRASAHWVYFLDDDNLIHPDLEDAWLDGLAMHPDAQWFVFGQAWRDGRRRLAPPVTPRVGNIDIGQCVTRADLCTGRFGTERTSDGAFFAALAGTTAPTLIDRDATWYNALR